MRLALALLCFFSACGPDGLGGGTGGGAGGGSGTFKGHVDLENQYAESLFTLLLRVKSGTSTVREEQPFVGKRLNYGDHARYDFNLADGQGLEFELDAISLGQNNDFGVIDATKDLTRTKSTLHMRYDYDLATAKFTVFYRWE